MPRPSHSLASAFGRRLRDLDRTRQSVDRAAAAGVLSSVEISQIYEGLFLAVSTSFETFLEDLFIGLLVQGIGLQSKRRDIHPRIVVRSHTIARELIIGIGSREYADWMPFSHTLRRAEIMFRGGRPFSLVTDGDKQLLSQCHVIRNAIAHKSRHSISKFENQVIGSLPLPARERTPGGYLRSIFRAYPPQTRYEVLSARLLLLARSLAE